MATSWPEPVHASVAVPQRPAVAPSSGLTAASLEHKAPTEIASKRTANSDTYDNHDGTFTASISPDPINYQPTAGGAWSPIDLSFTDVPKGNGRLRMSASPTAVEVGAPDDSAGFVSVDTGKGKISLHLAPGASAGKAGSKPTKSGHRADVSGLLDGVDLRVLPSADGFRLFLTLSAVPKSSSFTFDLVSPGLTPSLQSDGSIKFTDKSGSVAATMPAPYATDSTPAGRRGSGQMTMSVEYALTSQGSHTLLTVMVDPTWLASAVYPGSCQAV